MWFSLVWLLGFYLVKTHDFFFLPTPSHKKGLNDKSSTIFDLPWRLFLNCFPSVRQLDSTRTALFNIVLKLLLKEQFTFYSPCFTSKTTPKLNITKNWNFFKKLPEIFFVTKNHNHFEVEGTRWKKIKVKVWGKTNFYIDTRLTRI